VEAFLKLTQLTLRWDPSVSAFDAQPLEAFCANHDVLEVCGSQALFGEFLNG